MNRVFVVSPEGQSEPMVPIRCADEAEELQGLLSNNFDLLAGEQITPLRPRRWLLVRREMPVPDPASGGNRWSVDFLFVDQDAVPTFVECKRFNDTRSRREVVGQVMEYAANGQFYWDHATLTAYAEKTASAGEESLGDALTKLQQEEQLSSDLFFQKMEENLKEGRLRIVFFMEEAPVELKSIVEFLNNQMDRTEVLIIEARQYTKDSLHLIVPSLFGYTEQARQIKQVASIRTSEERRSWDRQSALEYISGNAPKEMLAPVKALLVFVDSHRDLLVDAYGTGQTPSIIVRNVKGRSILYIFSSGLVQLPIPEIVKTYDFALLQSVIDQYSERLAWKGPVLPSKYPSLKIKIHAMKIEEQEALKQLLLALASMKAEEDKD